METFSVNWQQTDFVTRWCTTIGSDDSPYGDVFREILVNPVVLAFASEVLARRRDGAAQRSDWHLPLYRGVAEQHHELSGSYTTANIRNWHSGAAERTDLAGLRVLDLGCGEAYLGRWLGRMGASYVGVDLPPKPASPLQLAQSRFLNEVKTGVIHPDKFRLVSADLDGSSFEAAPLDEALQNEGPDLVIMAVLLDHLSDPEPLLRWVGGLGERYQKIPAILCWTLNPDYYQANSTDITVDGPLPHSRIRHHLAPVRSIGGAVPVLLRCPLTYESHFAETNLNVIQTAPLDFPRHPASLEGQEASFRDGEPPFISWHLCQRARSIRPGDHSTLESLFNQPTCLLSQLPEEQKQLLREHLGLIAVETYTAYSTLLCPHNLGGDLLIVLVGTALLSVRGVVKRTFSPLDLLGDFETWSDKLPKRYFYPIAGGPDGVTVLRIPRKLVQVLLKNARSAGELLFLQLRDRFYDQMWLYEMRYVSKKTLKYLPGRLDIDVGIVNRIARVILFASGLEHETFSRTSGVHLAFLSINDLLELTREGSSRGSSDQELHTVFNILVGTRVIDSFHPIDLYSEQFDVKYTKMLTDDVLSSRLARFVWEGVMREAAQSIYGTLLDVPDAAVKRCLTGESVPEFSLADGITATNGKVKVSAKQAFLNGPLRTADRQKIPREMVESWFRYVAKAHYFLFRQVRQYFIMINDQFMLRAIALADDDASVEQLILAQSRTVEPETHLLQERVKRENLWSDSGFLRRKRYLQGISDFVRADLAKGARLAFSGRLTPKHNADKTMLDETFHI